MAIQEADKLQPKKTEESQQKIHFCEKCQKEKHCIKCCYTNRNTMKMVCEICHRKGHDKNCCPIIWDKIIKKQKRKMVVEFNQINSDDEDDTTYSGELKDENVKLQQIKQENNEALLKQTLIDKERINSQLCYRVQQTLKARNGEKYDEFLDQGSVVDISFTQFIYEALINIVSQEERKIYFQVITANIDQKDTMIDKLLLSKGIGSRYLDPITCKYQSLWISDYPIKDQSGIIVQQLRESQYQLELVKHWIKNEDKHKDYFFYLEY